MGTWGSKHSSTFEGQPHGSHSPKEGNGKTLSNWRVIPVPYQIVPFGLQITAMTTRKTWRCELVRPT